jgi:ketosteroid isomerase-like protein
MSQENVEALRRIYAAWSEGDFAAGGAPYDPYVVYLGQKGDRADPDPGPHYGIEAITGYMSRFLES